MYFVFRPKCIEELRTIVLNAAAQNKSIAIQGCRYSQGENATLKDGWIIDLEQWNRVWINTQNPGIAKIQAGATWKNVLRYLYEHGYQSVSIMQSDYDFSVGGTLAVNAHGWRMHKPPFIESVVGFSIMTADGEVHYCSRQKNVDLFNAAIGGYGLLGIILDVDLQTSTKRFYHQEREKIKTADFLDYFKRIIYSDSVKEFFEARFRLDGDNYLEELVINVLTPSMRYHGEHQGGIRQLFDKIPLLSRFANYLFGLTYKSNFFKKIRWYLESEKITRFFGGDVERTNVQYQGLGLYITRDAELVDVLQSFFIPLHQFDTWISFLKENKPFLSEHLMNLGVRFVKADHESILNYATTDMFCMSLLFRISRSEKESLHLQSIVRELTQKTLDLGGTYYLPCKPYATRTQFMQAYPGYQDFLAIKQHYDPLNVFVSDFYSRYLSPISSNVDNDYHNGRQTNSL